MQQVDSRHHHHQNHKTNVVQLQTHFRSTLQALQEPCYRKETARSRINFDM